MIIVTGCRRSGTSLWMQILKQGGFQVFGKDFPTHWQQFQAANKNGFYESKLIDGINYHTNPDPISGAYFSPQQTEEYAVKVLADGLVRSDVAFISKVIVTVRAWRDCEASRLRLKNIMNDQSSSINLPAGYIWWSAYAGLVHDMMSRQYSAAVFSYEALLQDPQKIVSQVFNWLGKGDTVKAAAAVEQSLQTQKNITLPEVNHDHSEIFDELYQALDQNIQITQPFYDKLAETNRKIQAEIDEITSVS